MKRYNTPQRHWVIKTRLTEEEYAEFVEHVSLCKMSQAEFIRQALVCIHPDGHNHTEMCDDYITQARLGEPYDVDHLPQEPFDPLWNRLFSGPGCDGDHEGGVKDRRQSGKGGRLCEEGEYESDENQ